MDFTDFTLSEEILSTLASLQYQQPTEVQRKVIPLVMEKHDVVVKSRTGSGKTASFAIPICEMIDWAENKPQALVLTPTRELAVQISEDFINIGRLKRINAVEVYGKQSFMYQKTKLKQKTHVVVGTPGRLLDHIQKGTIVLDQIRYLVIDEADEMLNMGFIEQVEAIIEKMPENRVTMLFSATLPDTVKNLAQNYLQSPVEVEIKPSSNTAELIEHSLIWVEEHEKLQLLQNVTIIENPDSCIIFCRTKDRVDMVVDHLTELGYDCDKIHGGMIQEDRLEVMSEFKRGEFRYLIATDVAARGIDIENISLVINFDIPYEKESYVHRTGRTGRAGMKGKATTFVTEREKRLLEEIEELIGFPIPQKVPPTAEQVAMSQFAFEQKISSEPEIKQLKSEELNKDITKLYFNGGKKKKLRAVDFVGTICRIEGVSAEDIGIITILDTASYVEILNGKGSLVLSEMKHTTVKGKQLKVHVARR
ncbi:DEAD/DEAH box helicase [Robertmurraya korlensis]|uniref:DEAD/DEAH box helicase n=1 Tax=Robertmurraya korlensis TaxID=519977 RepID=UPI002041D6D0|nr:DEAD/DEAH box helicase [Robertmurraya korlensis]MCM3602975.1 DEAD/DEAH box helicase [Robertmurraya korlensis]